MEKTYNHLEHEEKVYRLWEEAKAFSPSEAAETFTIMMPPPNANDPLHVGHAMFVTIEDVLIRYNRMKGKAALWLPGTDHAGIETQFVFEKKLTKEGKSRFQYDRETLYKMIWDYVQENSDVAVSQLKKIGASADWGRFKFMLEPEIVTIVLETFEQLHKDGLVYRDERLVNYCTKCGTAFSELEVDHQERDGQLYRISYKLMGGGQGVEVDTTRPETIFADCAIAIHPSHPRAKELMGRRVINPLTGIEMAIVTDEAVDPEFGTGALKITPFHDQADFEIWQRHRDEMAKPLQVIGLNGKMNEQVPESVQGLKVLPAREKVVKELLGEALVSTKAYHHAVGVCYRCGTAIEPLPLAQFFIKVKPLVEPVVAALDRKEIKVIGAGHDKILRHWLTTLKDWNISRQIVWGIRMPVWYEVNSKLKSNSSNLQATFTDKNGQLQSGNIDELLKTHSLDEIKKGLQSVKAPKEAEYVVSLTSPGESYIQETDTFDTWFSSAQWPYTTLMAGKSGDFERFYPTQVMETGYDILPFWVMRMLMMGIYRTKKAPFTNVYLHGLVRDEQGRKMSKSKGNVINPLSVIEKYGADALRMALVMSTTAGKDSNTGETKIRGMRNFTNKIWNAARYIMLSFQEQSQETLAETEDLEFQAKLGAVSHEIENHLKAFRIGMAAEVAYNQFWHWYCDEAIEKAKAGKLSRKALLSGLEVWLKLLHPFVPFVTEAVWQSLRTEKLVDSPTLLIKTPWPDQTTTK